MICTSLGVRLKANLACASVLAVEIIALMALSPMAAAQDWTLSSHLYERGLFNDNLMLVPHEQISTFGSITTPGLKLQRDTPTSSATISGDFPYSAYFGHSDLNSASQLIGLQANKDLSERSTLGFDAGFSHDTTLRSEQDLSDRFLVRPIRYIDWHVAPSFTYALGPVDSATWNVSYKQVEYNNTTAKTDYQYYGTSLDYQHDLSEVAAVTGTLSYNRFVPDEVIDSSSNIYGATVGYKYTPTDRLLIDGAAGISYDNTSTDGQPDDNTVGYLANLDFRYGLADQTYAKLTLSHQSEPSGDGRQLTRNRAALALVYRMTELTSFQLNTSYSDNQDYFGSKTDSDQSEGLSRLFSVSPSMSYRLTEEFSLTLQYQFRHKMFQDDGGSATSNAAFLTLRYNFDDVNWSGF